MTSNPTRGRPHRLTRRQVLETASLTVALSSVTVLGGSRAAAAEKMSQEQVAYQDSPQDDQRCSGCRFFVEGGQCERVEGEISPDGWCSLWTAK